MHINPCLCRSISTSVVSMASVLSSLSFSYAGDVQPIYNSSLPNTELCPGDCWRGNPGCIAVYCHIVIFSGSCIINLFHSHWNWKNKGNENGYFTLLTFIIYTENMHIASFLLRLLQSYLQYVALGPDSPCS